MTMANQGQRLSNKQRVFVAEYLKCWNSSEAARRAGYSRKNANVNGPRLLANAGIKAAIEAELAEIKMSAAEVLARLSDQARGSMDDFIDGGMVDLTRARDRGKMHLVKKFSRSITEKGDNVSIELYDAQNALIQLGRTHGLFIDKLAPTTPDGKGEFTGMTPDDKALAALELAEWQRQQKAQIESLSSSSSAPATPPTS